MKKFASLALGFVGVVALASAATCTPAVTNSGFLSIGGTTVFNGAVTCTATATAGNYITAVAINTLGDASNVSSGASVVWSFGNFVVQIISVSSRLAPMLMIGCA